MSDNTITTKLHEMVESLENLADRCARQLLYQNELKAHLEGLPTQLEQLLSTEAHLDAFRIYERMEIENRKYFYWSAFETKYVQQEDCKKVHVWLDLVHKVLESYEPAFLGTSLKNHILLQEGDFYGAKSKVFELLKRAAKRLDIVDSYLDEEIFPYLKSLPETLSCRLLTHNKKEIFPTLYHALRKSRTALEARESKDIHDRFIVLDEREVWNLGASLNGIGKKTCMLAKITDPIVATQIIAEIEAKWQKASTIPEPK
jgi:hypothetical protein